MKGLSSSPPGSCSTAHLRSFFVGVIIRLRSNSSVPTMQNKWQGYFVATLHDSRSVLWSNVTSVLRSIGHVFDWSKFTVVPLVLQSANHSCSPTVIRTNRVRNNGTWKKSYWSYRLLPWLPMYKPHYKIILNRLLTKLSSDTRTKLHYCIMDKVMYFLLYKM